MLFKFIDDISDLGWFNVIVLGGGSDAKVIINGSENSAVMLVCDVMRSEVLLVGVSKKCGFILGGECMSIGNGILKGWDGVKIIFKFLSNSPEGVVGGAEGSEKAIPLVIIFKG